VVISLNLFFDPEGGSQKGTLVIVVLVFVAAVNSSLKIPKAFLICSGAQRNFAALASLNTMMIYSK